MIYPKNFGLKPIEIKATDYIFGGISGVERNKRVENKDWTDWMPEREYQFNRYFDSMGCVSFAALNSLEFQFNKWLSELDENSPVENLIAYDFLRNKGYLKDNKINFSDRFTAKMSGTTYRGNSLVRVADTIRNKGLVTEKDYPFKPTDNWWSYYAPVPYHLKKRGLEFLKYFDIQYEWAAIMTQDIIQLSEALKEAPIQITVFAWMQPINGVYRRVYNAPNHAVTLFKIDGDYAYIFDHYDDDVKKLALDFRIGAGLKYNFKIKGYNPMSDLKNNTLVQCVGDGGTGEFGLYLEGKILVGKLDLVHASWEMRSGVNKKAITKNEWDSLPKYDIQNPDHLLIAAN